MEENLAMFLALRQKRAMYLQTQFDAGLVDSKTAAEIQALLRSYQDLLTRIARSKDESERATLKETLVNCDRKLTRAFEQRRMATSPTNQDGTSTTLVMKPR